MTLQADDAVVLTQHAAIRIAERLRLPLSQRVVRAIAGGLSRMIGNGEARQGRPPAVQYGQCCFVIAWDRGRRPVVVTVLTYGMVPMRRQPAGQGYVIVDRKEVARWFG